MTTETDFIPRKLETKLDSFLDRDEVIAITGPRQVGKTTLVKRMESKLENQGKQVKYLTFEDREQMKLFRDEQAFKQEIEQFDVVIIDEFQYADEGGRKLKFLYDTTNIKFIITGSSSLDLIFSTGKYMVGRMFTFNLYPFSFREFLRAKDKRTFEMVEDRFSNPLDKFDSSQSFGEAINGRLEDFFEEYIIYGGYPEVVKAKKEQKKKILQDLFNLYLKKEINGLLQLAGDDNLVKLAESLSAQIGELVSYNNLSELSGLKYKKLKKYLNILEETYVINLIRPFFTNRQKEIVKNPVAYFLDTGLRNYLVDDFREFRLRNDVGTLVENFVYMRLKEKFSTGFNNIKYWRSKAGAEVDFTVKTEGQQIPIEVKYRNDPTPGKSFYSFLRKYEPEEGYVLTKGKSKVMEAEGARINFVPVWYL